MESSRKQFNYQVSDIESEYTHNLIHTGIDSRPYFAQEHQFQTNHKNSLAALLANVHDELERIQHNLSVSDEHYSTILDIQQNLPTKELFNILNSDDLNNIDRQYLITLIENNLNTVLNKLQHLK